MSINQYGYDEHQRYDGVKKYYFAFEEAVERELKRACLIWVMEDKRKEPFAPVDILERAANGEQLSFVELRVISDYQKSMAEYDDKCTKALDLYIERLGQNPISRLDEILQDNDTNDRQKLQRCRVEMRKAYGTTSEQAVSEILEDIHRIPKAKDDSQENG